MLGQFTFLDFTQKLGPFLSGIGAILAAIIGLFAINKRVKHIPGGNFSNLIITHDVLRIRDLTDDDHDRIVELIRNFSKDATAALYKEWTKDRPGIEEKMCRCGLPELVGRFIAFDQSMSGVAGEDRPGQFRRELETWEDKDLFCPYGMLQAPFEKNAARYIQWAKDTAQGNPRDEFRMGVEYNHALIGCFVFHLQKKKLRKYQTIGDFGVFGESGLMGRPSAVYFPVVHFLERIPFPVSVKKRKILIGVTLHPCDYVRTSFFSSEYNFRLVDTMETIYGNSRRNVFVADYTGFVDKILSLNENSIQPVITTNGVARGKAPVFPFLGRGRRL
jgi:hypothetical protein